MAQGRIAFLSRLTVRRTKLRSATILAPSVLVPLLMPLTRSQPLDHIRQGAIGISLNVTLPHHDDTPTGPPQCNAVSLVTKYVSRELFRPKSFSRLGHRRRLAPLVPVPETTVNKYHGTILWQHDVGPPRQVTAMKHEPKTRAMQHGPNDQFRLGVRGSNPRHDHRTFGFRPYIHRITSVLSLQGLEHL